MWICVELDSYKIIYSPLEIRRALHSSTTRPRPQKRHRDVRGSGHLSDRGNPAWSEARSLRSRSLYRTVNLFGDRQSSNSRLQTAFNLPTNCHQSKHAPLCEESVALPLYRSLSSSIRRARFLIGVALGPLDFLWRVSDQGSISPPCWHDVYVSTPVENSPLRQSKIPPRGGRHERERTIYPDRTSSMLRLSVKKSRT